MIDLRNVPRYPRELSRDEPVDSPRRLEERIGYLEARGEPLPEPELLTGGSAENPYEMLPTAANIGIETAQTDTWDRNDPPGVVPATDPATYYDGVIYRGPRVVYNDTGDETIYLFTRDVTYDSAGAMAAISAETKYTIDTAGACP